MHVNLLAVIAIHICVYTSDIKEIALKFSDMTGKPNISKLSTLQIIEIVFIRQKI